MRRCPECNIEIGDPVSRCPLCGAKLEVTGDEQTGAFLYPAFSEHDKPRSSFPFLAKLFSFLSLITVGVCTLIDLLIAHRLTWSLYVTGAVVMLWGTVGLHLLAKINLNNMLLNDVCAVSLYLILVDHLSGWGRWSIDYVIPILYIGIMITTVILAVIFKVYWREYILSLVVVCILGEQLLSGTIAVDEVEHLVALVLLHAVIAYLIDDFIASGAGCIAADAAHGPESLRGEQVALQGDVAFAYVHFLLCFHWHPNHQGEGCRHDQ